jgi:selenocysteine lyase/cysteine desulfurase
MNINRREMLASVTGLAVSAAFGPASGAVSRSAQQRVRRQYALPRKADFAIPEDVTFLNSAYTHPLPRAAADAIADWAQQRARPGVSMTSTAELAGRVKNDFARLINARPDEIGFIPNTSTGENLVVNGLRIPERARSGINVVTDALHFEGALIHLQALQRERGLEVRTVMPKDFRIHIEDLERVIDRNTALVEISHVAMYNGFEHDLKAVSDLAHAHGALVYADIIQGAGAVPIDVRASGVDFCACAGFKWLMSDFGLGFLYAREGLLDGAVQRSQWGYHSVSTMATHFLPYDPSGDSFFSWEAGDDASAVFEVGSRANGALAALGVSLPYILSIGVENIQAYRQPMLRRLQEEMPRLGFQPVTPRDSTSPLITFATPDGSKAAARLREARINARVASNFIRLSPSIFNDMHDIERLLEALS